MTAIDHDLYRDSTDAPGRQKPPETGRHWLTRFDADDGEPYGTLCDCPIGEDHDGSQAADDTDEPA